MTGHFWIPIMLLYSRQWPLTKACTATISTQIRCRHTRYILTPPQHPFDTIQHSSVLIFMGSSLNVCSLLFISVQTSYQRSPLSPSHLNRPSQDLNFTCTVQFKVCAANRLTWQFVWCWNTIRVNILVNVKRMNLSILLKQYYTQHNISSLVSYTET